MPNPYDLSQDPVDVLAKLVFAETTELKAEIAELKKRVAKLELREKNTRQLWDGVKNA